MRFDDDLEEEIRAHLAIAAREKEADGANPEEARYAALREFGNVPLMTEATRRVWMPWWLEPARSLAGDVLYAIRALLRNPAFALTVVGVLTLGIGLNAAVFTMLKSFVLSPLAGVANAGGLATIHAETGSGRPVRVSYPEYQYLRDHAGAFTGLYGSAVATANLGRGKGARIVWTELVSGNYFQVLNVRAQRGRTLLPSDDAAPGGGPVVVISDSLWRRSFGADPDIVGKTLEFNNTPLTVVGVADAAFKGTTVVYDVEAFIPVTMAPSLGYRFNSQETTPAGILADRRATVFYPQGYPRASLEQASAEIDALWTALSTERPAGDLKQRLRVVPFLETPGGAPSFVIPTLGVLTAMALLVLTIACANIAGLVLVRGVSRRGEIAVRMALGASRRRIVRLLLVENLVLAVPGTVLGVLLAYRLLPVFVGYAEWLAAPQLIYFNLELDASVIAFSVLAACGSALVFGFLPAIQSSRVDLVSVINEDASPRGAARGRGRAGLVIAQVAVSLLLLVGSGLAARSVDAARHMNPGFDAAHVASVTIDVKQNGYDESRGRDFYRRLLAATSATPSAGRAALAAYHPLSMTDTRATRVTIEGYEPKRDEDLLFMSNTVTPQYFETLRVPLLAGRAFEERDDEDAAPVAIVNRTMAERFWGGAANAIGKRMRVDGTGAQARTVVGVAADLKYARIDEAPRPYFYLPFAQAYRSHMILHTRASAGPRGAPLSDEALVSEARAHVEALDPGMPIIAARPLAEEIDGAFIFLDLTSTMLFVFGVAGVLLAALGTYGLISYTVKQRTHEIGIRIALGAPVRAVVVEFVMRGLTLGAVGALIGVAAALAAGGALRSVLFGVSPTDPMSFARALAIVLAGVGIATLLPAWRAARTGPLTALRHQ